MSKARIIPFEPKARIERRKLAAAKKVIRLEKRAA